MIVPEGAQSTLRSLKGRVFSDLVDDGEKGKERPLKRGCVCVCALARIDSKRTAI